MDTLENNKLIAEFMGGVPDKKNFLKWHYRFERPFIYPTTPICECGCKVPKTLYSVHKNDLHYHDSWDWIMPVVEKIESLGYHSCIELLSAEETRVFFSHDSAGFRDKSKINAVYKSVLDFIEWYNKNK